MGAVESNHETHEYGEFFNFFLPELRGDESGGLVCRPKKPRDCSRGFLKRDAVYLEREGVFFGICAEGMLRFAVISEMNGGVVDALRVCSSLEGELFGILFLGGEVTPHFVENIEKYSGSSLSCFDARLVVGIDIHQGGVEGNGTFKEGNELTEGARVDFLDGNGERMTAIVI